MTKDFGGMIEMSSHNDSRSPTFFAAHNSFRFENEIEFSSQFDNGNLAKVEATKSSEYSVKGQQYFDFRIWSASDNFGEPLQSKHCAWFHFSVAGLPGGSILRIQLANASNHSGLYKHDMRPVYRSNATNQRWMRIRNSVRFVKNEDIGAPQLYFDHAVDAADDKIFFAFTYPYSYTVVQNDFQNWDAIHVNNFDVAGSIYYHRELLTLTPDGLRVDLVTISSIDGISTEREELLPGLFPNMDTHNSSRCRVFPEKEIMFISARVHPGEVPAQHTLKGILNLLMDPNDLRAKELRKRFVFKIIPILNPDGVYRGHFRMDEFGQNLNRYYLEPNPERQPTIYAAKMLIDLYAKMQKLALYLDLHAHASKRGCFIYGNVMDNVLDQVQNQLYCRLIAMNTPCFDYEGCLFSREHMSRIDPGDQAKGLTAEGSGRVATFLAHGIVHSYTLECNYNKSKVGNEISPCEIDPGGAAVLQASNYTTNPEHYTPASYAGVGRACLIAMLDLRGFNPCSRIPKSKLKSLERVRALVLNEVRSRKEYKGQQVRKRYGLSFSSATGSDSEKEEVFSWKRLADQAQPPSTPSCSISLPSQSTALQLKLQQQSASTNRRGRRYSNSGSNDFVGSETAKCYESKTGAKFDRNDVQGKHLHKNEHLGINCKTSSLTMPGNLAPVAPVEVLPPAPKVIPFRGPKVLSLEGVKGIGKVEGINPSKRSFVDEGVVLNAFQSNHLSPRGVISLKTKLAPAEKGPIRKNVEIGNEMKALLAQGINVNKKLDDNDLVKNEEEKEINKNETGRTGNGTPSSHKESQALSIGSSFRKDFPCSSKVSSKALLSAGSTLVNGHSHLNADIISSSHIS